MIRARSAAALVALAGLLGCGAVLAQSGDDQTSDHEEQDRRYYERYVKPSDDARPAEPAPDDPEAQIAAFLSRADQLIRDPNYRSATGERYRVQTDDPRVDAKAVGALLDSFRSFFDSFWSDRVELAPYEKTSRVFLFYSFYKFNQLLAGDWRFRYQRPKGHYRPAFDAITVHTDPDDPEALADSLVHEAAHQLLEQRLFVGNVATPIWLAEGLATYFGYTRLDADGRFRAGEVGGKASQLFRRGAPPRGREARDRLTAFRRVLRGKEAHAPFTGVLAIHDPSEFYGPDASTRYSASWLLVHYLLHGDDGRHAAAFARYLALEAEGSGGAETLYRELGLSDEELESAAREHVKRLKVR